VGYQANRLWPHGADQNAAGLEPRHHIRGARATRQAEDDDVGLNRIEVDGDALNVRQGLGQEARIGMVFVEPGGPFSRAMSPAAASTPAWRMPPPEPF